MSYTARKLSQTEYDNLNPEVPVFKDNNTGFMYTYPTPTDPNSTAPAHVIVQISEEVNNIMLPIIKGRKMFPR